MKLKAFELDPRVPLSEAVQCTALDELDSGATILEDQPEGIEEAIHEFRKSTKRVRGLLRLVRPALGDEYSVDNDALRDAAREFAELRDLRVLVETLDQPTPDASQDQLRAMALCRQLLTEQERAAFQKEPLGPRIQRALKAVSEVWSRVVHWEIEDAEVLEEGFDKTYERARKRFEEACNGDRSHLHDFRKRAKYHRYHLRLLRPVFRKALNAERKAAKELSGLLGDDHDLELLSKELEALGNDAFDSTMQDLLQDMIESRRRRLQRKALEVGQLVFAEKTKNRGKRIRHYIEASKERVA